MTNEEMAVTLSAHERDIAYLKEQTRNINDLVTSVKLLANNMERMAEEQERQGEKLEKLENAPAEKYENLRSTVVSCIVTGVISAILGAVFMLILK